MIAPVIVIERAGVVGAFGRSRELVRGNGWPVFGVVVVATLISADRRRSSSARSPTAIADGPILRIVFSTLASTFTAPIGALVAAILYYRLLAISGGPDPAAAGPPLTSTGPPPPEPPAPPPRTAAPAASRAAGR